MHQSVISSFLTILCALCMLSGKLLKRFIFFFPRNRYNKYSLPNLTQKQMFGELLSKDYKISYDLMTLWQTGTQ